MGVGGGGVGGHTVLQNVLQPMAGGTGEGVAKCCGYRRTGDWGGKVEVLVVAVAVVVVVVVR